MSTDNHTLGEFTTDTLEDATATTESDQLETRDVADWHDVVSSTETKSKCGRCDEHVTPQFRRTFGDRDDDVYGCLSCYSQTEIRNGAAMEGCDGDERRTL